MLHKGSHTWHQLLDLIRLNYVNNFSRILHCFHNRLHIKQTVRRLQVCNTPDLTIHVELNQSRTEFYAAKLQAYYLAQCKQTKLKENSTGGSCQIVYYEVEIKACGVIYGVADAMLVERWRFLCTLEPTGEDMLGC